MDTTPAAAPPRLDAATYYLLPDGGLTDADGVYVIPPSDAPIPDDLAAPDAPAAASSRTTKTAKGDPADVTPEG